MMNPSIIDEFETRVAEMQEQVRAENGCLHYSLLVEDKATGKVNVMEIWEDDDALGVHFTQPWIGAFLNDLAQKCWTQLFKFMILAAHAHYPSSLPIKLASSLAKTHLRGT